MCILFSENETPEISNPNDGTQNLLVDPEPAASWSQSATLLLISLYKEFNTCNPKQKRKILWEKIRKGMQNHSLFYSCQQVENKWKSLTNTYRKKKDKLKKTGEGRSRTNFPFENELDEIYGENHDTAPAFLMGTDIATPSTSSIPESSDDLNSDTFQDTEGTESVAREQDEDTSTEDQGNTSNTGSPSRKKKRKSQTQSSQVLTFLQNYTADINKMEQQRREDSMRQHEEKINILKSFIDVLKK